MIPGMNSTHRFAFPTAIHFGPGARHLVAEHLKAQGVRRPLIVTDKGLAALPILHDFAEELEGLEVKVYAGVAGNPVKKQVDDGVAAYKAHRADGVVGFGGGAALDVAKAVALMAVHEGDVLQYAWDHPRVLPVDQGASLVHRAAHHERHRQRGRALGGDLATTRRT